MDNLEIKYLLLQDVLREMGKVLVAFSGGVDSTLLLRTAKDTLGEKNILAVTALSEITPTREWENATALADWIGIEHLPVETHELELESFVNNPDDKCYICKKYRFGLMIELAEAEGFPYVVDGENADDQTDYRPGSRASRELGIRSPLLEADLSKEDVRTISRRLGLPTWNKPAIACLASRIPYGQTITAEKLKQVDAGEEFLIKLGISSQVRVRHYGNTVRIELDEDGISKIMQKTVRDQLIDLFNKIGFKYVTLDLAGYRMGSLNKALQSNQES